jgi:uncharacterized protein
MSGSLQEQLLKAGLVDSIKVKSEKKERHKQKKSGDKVARASVDEKARRVEQARRDKAERDRQINQQRQRQIELKAARAQIGEIIDQHRLDRAGAETPYQFVDRGRVKKIFVDSSTPRRLASGDLAVVRLEGRYDVVPAVAAEKIAARDARSVIVFNDKDEPTPAVDDDYADFPVPDDLTW